VEHLQRSLDERKLPLLVVQRFFVGQLNVVDQRYPAGLNEKLH
jgi:hypothetical protein